MACKLVEGSDEQKREGHYNLINVHNRGGLWKAKRDVVLIFTLAESYFLSATKEFVSKIDTKDIVSRMMEDVCVLAYLNSICRSTEEKIKKEISQNLLEDMLTLYIRLRSHFYAKDKQQLHKITKDSIRKRSLRKELAKENMEKLKENNE